VSDWDVVEEALRLGNDPGHPSVAFAALARLSAREQELERECVDAETDRRYQLDRARYAEARVKALEAALEAAWWYVPLAALEPRAEA
jgi:hypothetical protein